MVLKYLTQINASIANLQTQVSNLETSFANESEALRRARDEDVRAISSRIAHIGTHVSYLRQNVCQSINRNVSVTECNDFQPPSLFIKIFLSTPPLLTSLISLSYRGEISWTG